MHNLTSFSYTEEIESIAKELIVEAMAQTDNDKDSALDLINDTLAWEVVDGHQWVIYYAYNLDVLKLSENPNYFEETIGGADDVLKTKGLSGLLSAMAFYAMYADVLDVLEALDFDEIHTEEES
jgi:hypothetical protein